MTKEESLSDKIQGLKGDDLANWYKEHEKFIDNLSSMEICNENHNCNEFVIEKLKEKITKDVKEAVKKLKEEIVIIPSQWAGAVFSKINKIFGSKLIE